MNTTPLSDDTLHLIVPCMGRLEFVKQTIGHALALPNVTYTLVDYSCPQKTGEWVQENYPEARVVFAEGRSYWHASHARNLGAATIESGWLCFLDSDVTVSPGFSEMTLAHVKAGSYLVASDKINHLFGFLICSKEEFDKCGGYDENIRGWGWEDNEMRVSLDRYGLKQVVLPDDYMDHINHDHGIRTALCEFQDRYDSFRINRFYTALKGNLVENGWANGAAFTRTYNFVKDHYHLGFPWLSALYHENDPKLAPNVLRLLTPIARDYKGMEAERWGDVHAIRIESVHHEPMLELYTECRGQTVYVRAEGRSRVAALGHMGESLSFPVEDGLARISLTGDPILLLDSVELVKDIRINVAPAWPSLAVELAFAAGAAPTAAVEITIGEQPAVCREVIAGASGMACLAIQAGMIAPEQPQDVTVRVTANGMTQETKRRTTFLTAARVTVEEAAALTPPIHLTRFQLAGPEHWVDSIPDSYKGPEDLSAEVAWGWTDKELICWIERRDDVWVDGSYDGDGVQIAIQPRNERANYATRFQFTMTIMGEYAWMELNKRYLDAILDAITILDDSVDMDSTGNRRRMVIRLPFELLEMVPAAGHTLGLSMTFNDNDGEGRKGWLEWGGGIGVGDCPRAYNEITLC